MAEPKNYDLLKTVFLLIWKEKKELCDVIHYDAMLNWIAWKQTTNQKKKKKNINKFQIFFVEMIPPTSSGVIPAIGIRLTRPLLLLLLKYSEKYFI